MGLGVAIAPARRMIPAMKILTTLVCVPLLAAVTAIPAQEKKGKQDAKPTGVVSDTKTTKGDSAIMAMDKFIASESINKSKNGWKTTLSKPPKLTFSADKDYFWHVETAVGAMKIRYFQDTAPMHVSSGIYLSRLGFYDGLNFHRIIPGFMAQGACPNGTGGGRPGYTMKGEFKGGQLHNKPGLLSMANAGPGTDGSQFFLTFVQTPHLNGKHTVWGEVVEGQATLKALAKLGTRSGRLKSGPKILRTWIEVAAKPKPKKQGGQDKEGKGEHGKKEGRGEHGGGGGEHGGGNN